MPSVLLHLADGTPDGTIELEPSGSIIKALRCSRDRIRHEGFDGLLRYHGVYMYLFPDGSVYVGQAAIQSLQDRIFAPHTDGIEQAWTYIVVFACCRDAINRSEIDYLENALCEYAYANYRCVNRNPSVAKCTKAYRDTSLGLTLYARAQCEAWHDDIIRCLKALNIRIMPESQATRLPPPPPPRPEQKLFYYRSPSRGTDGTALIDIRPAVGGQRHTVLKAGSHFSTRVNDSPKFHAGFLKVQAQRLELENQGKLENLVLLVDLDMPSPHDAIQLLNGASMNANTEWRAETGETLKEVLAHLSL